jgi:hypothetical protein
MSPLGGEPPSAVIESRRRVVAIEDRGDDQALRPFPHLAAFLVLPDVALEVPREQPVDEGVCALYENGD